MQWLFFVTTESFLSRLDWPEKVAIFLNTPLIIIIPCLMLAVFLAGLGRLLKHPALLKICEVAFILLPSFFLAGTFLLMIENFSYNLLGFNLFFFKRHTHYLYALIFLALWHWSFKAVKRTEQGIVWHRHSSLLAWFCAALVGASGVCALGKFHRLTPLNEGLAGKAAVSNERPNIFLIGSDMVEASHLSVYGYERDTTPFLRRLAGEMLVAENALANSNHSLATILSMLSGKTALETRVVHFPHLLEGDDVYLHLPGILRGLGYKSIEMSERRYADAFDANLRHGFDWANYRDLNRLRLPLVSSYKELYSSREYFFYLEMREAILLRLQYIFGLKSVELVHRGLWWPIAKRVRSDHFALEEVKRFMEQNSGPFFVHLHFLGTHGPRFALERQVFSRGQRQAFDYQDDFYDDAIREFDERLKDFLGYLKARGLLEQSIIVVYSDHDPPYNLNVRLPLLIRFPRSEYAGRIKSNVQSIDLPVTLLDYLKFPTSMPGWSLLKGEPPQSRLLFSLGGKPPYFRRGGWPNGRPPFFLQLGVAVCQKSFKYDFAAGVLEEETIEGHTAPCDERNLPDRQEIEATIQARLAEAEVSDPLRELYRY